MMTNQPFTRGDILADEGGDAGFRITLAQVKAFLPRYKWVIGGVFLFTVIAAYGALSLTTELYDTRASLLVKIGRENLDPPVTARNAVLSTGVRREELGSEVQILQAPDLVEEVVDELGVEAFRVTRVPPETLFGKAKFYTKAGLRWAKGKYKDALIALDLQKRLSERDAAIALVVDQLRVEPQKDSDVIGLNLRLADPGLAERIQNSLMEKYLARRVQVRRNTGVKEFFEQEVADLKGALEVAEREVSDWRRQSELTLPSEQKALLLRQIRDLSAKREQTTSRMRALTVQVEEARSLSAAAAERVSAVQVELPKPAAQQLRERIVKLETERARLLTNYRDGAAPVLAVEQELATVRQVLASQDGTEVGSVTTAINPARQQLEQSINQDSVTLRGLAAESSVQEAQLTRLQDELRRVESGDVTLMRLERERQIAEANYLAATKRLTDADVASELDVSRISNVAIAMLPTSTLQPVYPRKLLIMALALVLGLVLGLALAIGLEWTSDTVHDTEELEAATDLVCLATFGRDRTARFSREGAA